MIKKVDKESDVAPLIQIEDKIEGVKVPDGMKKLFVSYSILDLTNGQMGFGNTITLFDMSNYNADNMEKFIEHLQKSIDMAIHSKTGQRVQTRVLFFR